MRLGRLLTWAVLCIAVAGLGVPAQDNESCIFVPQQPGKWKPLEYDPDTLRGHPSQLAAYNALAAQILALMRKVPVLASPAGFELWPHGVAGWQPLDGTTGPDRLVSGVMLWNPIFQKYLDSQKIYLHHDANYFTFTVSVNGFGCVLDGVDAFEDEQGKMYLAPAGPTGEAHGFPVYKEHCVFMTRRTVPLVLPVPQSRYLAWAIKEAENALAKKKQDLAKAIPPQLANSPQVKEMMAQAGQLLEGDRQYIQQLRSQLAGMSAADRQAPAYITVAGHTPFPLATPEDEVKVPVMFVNPHFADQSLPGTAPQVFQVTIKTIGDVCEPLARQIEEQFDWNGLAALLR